MRETNDKTRLLYIITKAELGGAQSHVLDLVHGFAGRYEVHLAVGGTGPLVEQAMAAGATVHFLQRLKRSINPFSDVAAVRECVALVRRVQPEFIHAHSSKAGIVGRLAGRFTGTPTIFTAHGWGFSPGVPRLRQILALRIEKAMAPLAKKVICVSEFDCELAVKHRVGKSDTLVTVRNGIAPRSEKSEQSELAEVRMQPPCLLMVARFSEQKDQVTLLQALALIEDDLHLDFVGSGPRLQACQEMASTLGLTNRVSFLGDRSDVDRLLQQSQIFVLSTRYEGLPISILEAMRRGLPVIATDVGGVSEQVENNVTGVLVPPQNVEALSRALRRLIRAPDLRVMMGRAAHSKFEREFSMKRMIDDVDEVYRSVQTVSRA